MGESEIIKRFLNIGLQLDRKTLDYFKNNKKNIGIFIERFGKLEKKPKTITLETIQELLRDQPFNVKTENMLSERKMVSISGLVNSMVDRYNLLKEILKEKKELKNLISINKISPNTKEFSIICMVRSLENNTIVVEDTTGELILDRKKTEDTILQDDIIGLLCEQKDGRMFVKKIVWPGIPLKREIKRLEKEMGCVFIGSKVQKIDTGVTNMIVFAAGPKRELKCTPPYKQTIFLSEDSGPNEEVHTPPFITKLNGINIVVLGRRTLQKYKKYWKGSVEVVKNLLKRRDIDPIQGVEQNYMTSSVLTTLPDIIVFPNEGEHVSNYKGTTIISIPKDGGYHIDLSTREVKKI
jgi:DNA polymerase II small subunit/DNA polymerase delta subunit B